MSDPAVAASPALARRYADLVAPADASLWRCLAGLALGYGVGFLVIAIVSAVIGFFVAFSLAAGGDIDRMHGALDSTDSITHFVLSLLSAIAILASTWWLLPRLLKRPLSSAISVDGQFDWALWLRGTVTMFAIMAVFTLPWVATGKGSSVTSPASGPWIVGLLLGAVIGFVASYWMALAAGSLYQVLSRLFRNDIVALVVVALGGAVFITLFSLTDDVVAAKFQQSGGIMMASLFIDMLFMLLVIRRTGGLEAAIGLFTGSAIFTFSIVFAPGLSSGPAQALFLLTEGPASTYTLYYLIAELAQMGLLYGLLCHSPWRLGRRTQQPEAISSPA